MAKFCGNCGSPMNETAAFCGACGARVPQANVPLAAPAVSLPPPVSPLPPVRQGTSPLVKIVLVVVVLLFVGGALATFGMFYALHLASRKAHQFSRQVLGSGGIVSSLNPDRGTAGGSDGGITGPGACTLLSKEAVGRSIGVAIVATRTTATGCEYLAKGTPAELTGKHIAAMMAARGASTQQQQMIQNLSRGLLGSAQNDADGDSPNPEVNSAVLAFTIDPNSAKTQMTLDQNAPGSIGSTGKPLAGIGDEAFDTAGSIMTVRKGNKLIRIIYSTCPCTVNAIKPLAQQLAGAL